MFRNLIQYRGADGELCVGLVHSAERVEVLAWRGGVYGLAKEAIARRKKLLDVMHLFRTGSFLSYDQLDKEKRLLSPITHADPAHLMVSGTGLTHLGSADTRAAMHAKLAADEAHLTDSMRMFRMGLQGGKPSSETIGVQPEWFYKGDGSIVAPPGGDVESPDFGLDFGDEVEVAGVYLVGDDGIPYRLGYVLGNEFSDHKTEKINYLYLAHSKLRPCSFGPELVLGNLPSSIEGTSRIIRNGEVVWEQAFLSGEINMTHSIANLENHHFKYQTFLRPGDVHVHFFGTSTLSFSNNFETLEGDIFEVQCPWFGRPLRNCYRKTQSRLSPRDAVVPL